VSALTTAETTYRARFLALGKWEYFTATVKAWEPINNDV